MRRCTASAILACSSLAALLDVLLAPDSLLSFSREELPAVSRHIVHLMAESIYGRHFCCFICSRNFRKNDPLLIYHHLDAKMRDVSSWRLLVSPTDTLKSLCALEYGLQHLCVPLCRSCHMILHWNPHPAKSGDIG